MDFTKDLLEYTNNNSNNNVGSVGSNARSVGANNSGRPCSLFLKKH